MGLDVSRVDVWAATIRDRAGGAAEKLGPLSAAGANLESVVARRSPGRPGKGVMFLTPLKGAAQTRAAKKAGFKKAAGLHSVRVEGPDKPGVGAKITQALADAGLSMRGLSAAAIRKRFVVHLGFDTSAQATKAMRVLKKLS